MKFGSPAIPLHLQIFHTSWRIAHDLNIPIVFWGENCALEYGAVDKKLSKSPYSKDWFNTFGKRAIDHFGRTTEAKRTDASGAWYKQRDWRGYDNNDYYFVNDLLGERIPITQEQYQDENLVRP